MPLIRTVGPRDMWALRRKPHSRLFLFDEAMLARGHRPTLFAALCLLALTDTDRLTLTYRDGGLRGLLQARRRPGRPEADLLYLAAMPYGRRTPPPTDPDVWYRLLERLIAHVGGRGIQRIFAAHPEQSPAAEVLRQLGFQTYGARQVWRINEPTLTEGSELVALRHQSRRDAFAIQQLYLAVAPKVVQQAEQRSSASWYLPLPRISWMPLRRKGWVLRSESSDGLDVAIQAWIGPGSTVLLPLIRPEVRHRASAALSFSMSQLPPGRPIYLLLPNYQQELGGVLEELGFAHVGDQMLTVKSTVVAARHPLLVPIRDTGREPMIAPITLSSPELGHPTPSDEHVAA